MWMDQWNGPNDPVAYVRTVVARTMSVKKISVSSDKLSQKIDLDELFHPRTFLIALKQQTAKYVYIITLVQTSNYKVGIL